MFGEHAPFIVPAYVISFLLLAGCVVWTWRTWRLRQRELDRLNALHATEQGQNPS